MTPEEKRQRKRDQQRKWIAAHPGYNAEYVKRRYINHGDRYRLYARRGRLKMLYGLSESQYEDMLTKQGSKCAICKGPPGRYRLAVDHNHQTGQIRELLCTGCNVKLHTFESSDFRGLAETYLRKHKA